MSKIHPQVQLSSKSSPCNLKNTNSTKKYFTIWMKSLVLGGKGCTVYDSEGQLVYRVDNYNSTCRNEVCLMDSNGTSIFTMVKKKYSLSDCWEVQGSPCEETTQKSGLFRVKKCLKLLGGDSCCEVSMRMGRNQPSLYKIESQSNKVACKIVNKISELVAEVYGKQSPNGVVLGHDVLTLVVEPCEDHSLIVAFLVAFSLIKHRI